MCIQTLTSQAQQSRAVATAHSQSWRLRALLSIGLSLAGLASSQTPEPALEREYVDGAWHTYRRGAL